jgi:hypothetical protein
MFFGVRIQHTFPFNSVFLDCIFEHVRLLFRGIIRVCDLTVAYKCQWRAIAGLGERQNER